MMESQPAQQPQEQPHRPPPSAVQQPPPKRPRVEGVGGEQGSILGEPPAGSSTAVRQQAHQPQPSPHQPHQQPQPSSNNGKEAARAASGSAASASKSAPSAGGIKAQYDFAAGFTHDNSLFGQKLEGTLEKAARSIVPVSALLNTSSANKHVLGNALAAKERGKEALKWTWAEPVSKAKCEAITLLQMTTGKNQPDVIVHLLKGAPPGTIVAWRALLRACMEQNKLLKLDLLDQGKISFIFLAPFRTGFLGWKTHPGLLHQTRDMIADRKIAIALDLDETLVKAYNYNRFHKNKMTEDEEDGFLGNMSSMMHQFYNRCEIFPQGTFQKIGAKLKTVVLTNGSKKQRPVIDIRAAGREYHKCKCVFTRINCDDNDSSMLITVRPGWEDRKTEPGEQGYEGLYRLLCQMHEERAVEVYVCSTAQREYAFECWRILDSRGILIPREAYDKRIITTKHSNTSPSKSMRDVIWGNGSDATNGSVEDTAENGRHPHGASPCVPLTLIVDDRMDVWYEKDRASLEQVPKFDPVETFTQGKALYTSTPERTLCHLRDKLRWMRTILWPYVDDLDARAFCLRNDPFWGEPETREWKERMRAFTVYFQDAEEDRQDPTMATFLKDVENAMAEDVANQEAMRSVGRSHNGSLGADEAKAKARAAMKMYFQTACSLQREINQKLASAQQAGTAGMEAEAYVKSNTRRSLGEFLAPGKLDVWMSDASKDPAQWDAYAAALKALVAELVCLDDILLEVEAKTKGRGGLGAV